MFQGVRQLPEGTIVLWVSTFGRHGAVGEPFALGRGFYLVSWFVPIWIPVILPPPANEPFQMPPPPRRRHISMRGKVLALRGLGLLSALLLILGLPLAASRFGVWGFLIAFALLLALCIAQGLIEAWLRYAFGASWWQIIGTVLTCLWPFNAPLAIERVQALIWKPHPRSLLVKMMLDEPTFAQFFRRQLYDVSHGRVPEIDDDLRTALEEHLAKTTYRTPAPDDPRYCPRCGAGFNEDVESCTDCDDVRLENSGTGSAVG